MTLISHLLEATITLILHCKLCKIYSNSGMFLLYLVQIKTFHLCYYIRTTLKITSNLLVLILHVSSVVGLMTKMLLQAVYPTVIIGAL